MGAESSGSSAMSRVESSASASGWLTMSSGSCDRSGLDGLGWVVILSFSGINCINSGSGGCLLSGWVGCSW